MNTTLRMKIVVPGTAGIPVVTDVTTEVPTRSGGSTAPREFLAMRARQKKARLRARRWKLGLLGVGCAGMIAAALTMPRWRQSDLALAEVRSPAVAVPPAPAPQELPAPVAAEPAPAVLAAEAAPAAPPSSCDDDFAHRQWRAAIASCTTAFGAAPDAAVALKIAHSQWSRGETARAGTWAARAVSLGTDNADAFVLIGHAERRAGHPTAAIAAYRRYLRRAPYGWHAVRVRAAIRELKTETPEAAPTASN
jgi:hypothetical protein